MELYQLKYFLYASKYENISKAAQELRVAQPSVSKAILALEKEMQVELFERKGKKIQLTYAGRMLREQISPVLWKLEELPDELRHLGKSKDVIKLNAVSAVSLLAEIIRKFKEEEPDVVFVITDQREKTDWDLCICSAGPGMAYTDGKEILKERVCLGVSDQSRLRERQKISLAEVKDENFILLPKGTVLRKLADTRFWENHFLPRISIECDSTHLVWDLVGQNVGIALWPEYSWGQRKDVHLVDIEEPGFFRSIFLLRQRTAETSLTVERFIQCVEDYMSMLE